MTAHTRIENRNASALDQRPPASAVKMETRARAAICKLRDAFAGVIDHVSGDIRRPVHLQQALDLHYNVSWQIFQIAKASDPLSVSHHVPTTITQFTAAAAKAGVPQKIIDSVDKAFAEFNKVVAAYADDRSAFDTMLAAFTGGQPDETLALQLRRKAYRSEFPLWGAQIGVAMGQLFVRLSPEGNGLDESYVHFKHELRRLRQGVVPNLHGIKAYTTEGPLHSANIVALEPEAMATYGAPLLPKFCSQPVPRLLNASGPDGWTYNLLDSQELGRKSSVTVAFSGVALGTPFDLDEQGRLWAHAGVDYEISIPTELLILEMFLHRPSFGHASPQFQAIKIGTNKPKLPEILRRSGAFPMHEQVESLGPVPQMKILSKIPRHAELVNHVFNQLHWNPAEFDAYRVCVQYPVLHTDLKILASFEMNALPR